MGEICEDIFAGGGSIYIAGESTGNCIIDGVNITNNGGLDALVARFDDTTYVQPVLVAGVEKREFTMYPNPAHDMLTIRTDKGAYSALEISNELGQRVASQKAGDQITEVVTEMLAPGLYFIKLSGPKGVCTGKFVKL
jgi:hypothetical protein